MNGLIELHGINLDSVLFLGLPLVDNGGQTVDIEGAVDVIGLEAQQEACHLFGLSQVGMVQARPEYIRRYSHLSHVCLVD